MSIKLRASSRYPSSIFNESPTEPSYRKSRKNSKRIGKEVQPFSISIDIGLNQFNGATEQNHKKQIQEGVFGVRISKGEC